MCLLLKALSLKVVLSISCIYSAAFPSSKQNLTQIVCFLKSGITKSRIALNTHNS